MFQDDLYQGVLGNRDVLRIPVSPNTGSTSSGKGFDTFTGAYAFTNEDLETLIESVDSKGKRLLGVIGSGDHMLSSIWQGCDNYVGVDISIFACFFAELKFAAIKKLDYDAFKVFLGVPHINDSPEDISAFSEENYGQLRSELSETATYFFDNIIGYQFVETVFNSEPVDSGVHRPIPRERKVPLTLHYLVNRTPSEEMQRIPFLKTEDAYNATQEKLQQMHTPIFRVGGIETIDDSIDGNFDMIYVSNVHLTPTSLITLEKWEKEDPIKFIEKLSMRLNPEGIIVGYSNSLAERILRKSGLTVSKVETKYLGEHYLIINSR